MAQTRPAQREVTRPLGLGLRCCPECRLLRFARRVRRGQRTLSDLGGELRGLRWRRDVHQNAPQVARRDRKHDQAADDGQIQIEIETPHVSPF